MPMFRSFVPRKIQPWIYLFIAITFQLSGGVYLGALNQMIGGMASVSYTHLTLPTTIRV